MTFWYLVEETTELAALSIETTGLCSPETSARLYDSTRWYTRKVNIADEKERSFIQQLCPLKLYRVDVT